MDLTITGTVAWRAFTLADEGALIPPFVARYWPHAAEPWTVVTVARCAAGIDHDAPAENCTCGIRGTADLADLLLALVRPFAGTTVPILDECAACWPGSSCPGAPCPASTSRPTTRRRPSERRGRD